jgi:D-serine deaminase-like pyridoxal phosphate-dependent protein
VPPLTASSAISGLLPLGGASVRAVSAPNRAPSFDRLLDRVSVDALTRGFALAQDPIPLREVGAQGWSLGDLSSPILVLHEAAMRHNLALMAGFCERANVELAPHGKTSMAPQLWARQLVAGAWGITAASAREARVMRAAGVRRILIANELVDRPSIEWAASQLHDESFELLCYVDSIRGVELLDRTLASVGSTRPLRVLIELGHLGGRTGCRTAEQALEVVERVRTSERMELAGVAGYEGTLGHDRSPGSLERVRTYLDGLRDLASRLLDDGAFSGEVVLSAGGSRFFDLVAERLREPWPSDAPVRVILRSGCYLTHDSGVYERTSPFASEDDSEQRFHPAMTIWGSVLSRPEPALAILGFGRRDVPFDEGFPVPTTIRTASGETEPVVGRLAVTALNDQHAYAHVAADVSLGVGDLVACGISHPCSAFDRWRVIPVLDELDRVVEAVATFF